MIERLAAALALLLAAALAWQSQRLGAERAAHARTQAAWAGERAATAQAEAANATRYRKLEGEHRDTTDRIRADAQTAIAAARGDADRARAAGQRLQQHASAWLAAQRAAAQAGATEPGGTPGLDAAQLLAELFGAADERAGELAQAADAARASGSACERQYDSARAMIEAAQGLEGGHAQTP